MAVFEDDKKVYNLAIFPLKNSILNFDDALKSNRVKQYRLKKDSKLDGILCLGEEKSKTPTWIELLQDGINEALPKLNNTSNRALLLIKYDKRFYAIPFGYGKHLLRDEAIDRDLALKTALNLLDPDNIRSIDRADLENFNMLTKYQSNVKARQEEFQVDPIKDLLKGFTGGLKIKDSILGINVTGGEGIYINPTIDFGDILPILKEISLAVKSKAYRQKFDWVDNLRLVKDPAVIDQLRMLLLDALINQESNIILSSNRFIDWESFVGVSFTPKGDIQNVLAIETFYLENNRELRNDWGNFLTFRVYFHFSSFEEPVAVPLWKCLIYEVEYDKFYYVLTDGEWYKINPNYVQQIKNYASTFNESKSMFINCKEDYSEGTYNTALADSCDDFFLMDKKLVTTEFYRSSLEVCDVITAQKELIHVKFYYSSATLSHLFAQGRISSNLLMRDDSFRKNTRKMIASVGADRDLIPIKQSQFRRSDYTITFAIIDRKQRSFIETLPFFSLLNFRLTAEELVNWGYVVKVKKINVL